MKKRVMIGVLEVMVERNHLMSILNGHIQCPNRKGNKSQIETIHKIQEAQEMLMIWKSTVQSYPTGWPEELQKAKRLHRTSQQKNPCCLRSIP
jgi:hypothetical protein